MHQGCNTGASGGAKSWLQTALDSAQTVAWQWDKVTGRVTLAGFAIPRLGLVPGERDLAEVTASIHPEHRQRVADRWLEAVNGKAPFSIEFRLLSAGPREVWVALNGAPVTSGTGREGMAGVAYEITDRKRAEREFIANENLYRRIVETVAEAICVIDAQGRITYANPPAAVLTGYSLSEIVGRSVFDPIASDDREEAIRRFERRKTGATDRYEIRLRRKDGTPIWVDVSGTPMLDEWGRFAGSLIIATDITARKAAEAELVRQREALERSNADLQQFAYVTSHDLQEPLRTINSYSQLIGQRYRSVLDEEAGEFFGYITDSVRRMDRLIRDLLVYSRVVNQDAPPREETALTGIVQWAMMNLQHSVRESQALIEFENLPVVYGDRTELAQLFQNLLSNAIKYRGEKQPVVRISAQQAGDEWQISVADNGIGIAPEYHERVFGLFKRLHGPEYPGTGLGLAICKRIVEKHGGRIWVEAAADQGATFHFTLPG